MGKNRTWEGYSWTCGKSSSSGICALIFSPPLTTRAPVCKLLSLCNLSFQLSHRDNQALFDHHC